MKDILCVTCGHGAEQHDCWYDDEEPDSLGWFCGGDPVAHWTDLRGRESCTCPRLARS